MQKHKGRSLVPPKKKRKKKRKKGWNHVSLIGAYWFNEIEPHVQISKDAVLRKSFKQQY